MCWNPADTSAMHPCPAFDNKCSVRRCSENWRMSFRIHVWKGFTSPEPQGSRGPFKTQTEAEAACKRDGVPLDVELADRGPETVWATIERFSVADWRFGMKSGYGALLISGGIATLIVADRHRPVPGSPATFGAASGWHSTTYDLVRIGGWALFVFGVVILLFALIREVRA